MTDPTGGFGGPDEQLRERYSRALAGPSLIALQDDDAWGLQQRVIDAGTWDALSAEDQALLERGILEVNAGQSPTLQGEFTGDWGAEDAALDADDDELDGVLTPVDDDAGPGS